MNWAPLPLYLNAVGLEEIFIPAVDTIAGSRFSVNVKMRTSAHRMISVLPSRGDGDQPQLIERLRGIVNHEINLNDLK